MKHFTLERIKSSSGSFDSTKLWAVQDHYMGDHSADEKLALMLPFLVKAKLVSDPPSADAVATVRPGLYDCLEILGREQSLARIAHAMPMWGIALGLRYEAHAWLRPIRPCPCPIRPI